MVESTSPESRFPGFQSRFLTVGQNEREELVETKREGNERLTDAKKDRDDEIAKAKNEANKDVAASQKELEETKRAAIKDATAGVKDAREDVVAEEKELQQANSALTEPQAKLNAATDDDRKDLHEERQRRSESIDGSGKGSRRS